MVPITKQSVADPYLAFFSYEHLPVETHYLCEAFKALAEEVANTVPCFGERTGVFVRLLEARDAAVRSIVFSRDLMV